MIFNRIKNKNNVKKYEAAAWNEFVNYNYMKALNFYNKAITNLGDNKEKLAEYFFYQAVINKNLNNLKTASNLINKAIDIKDDNYNFYLERVEIKKLLKDNDYEKDLEKAYYLLKGFLSDEDYVEVLKTMSYDSTSRNYANDYEMMYIKINNPCKLIEYINKLINIYPEDVSLLDLKTDALTRINDLNSAIETINKAIKISPNCGHYYLMRGGLYSNLNHLKEAKADIEKALTFELSEADKDACNQYLVHIKGNV